MPLIDLRTLRVLTTALLFLLVLSFLYVAHHWSTTTGVFGKVTPEAR